MSNNNSGKANCHKCRHYAITWNPNAPNACKLLGFKSVATPSAVVYETTGKMCEGFAPKADHKANARSDNDASTGTQGVIVCLSSKKERK